MKKSITNILWINLFGIGLVVMCLSCRDDSGIVLQDYYKLNTINTRLGNCYIFDGNRMVYDASLDNYVNSLLLIYYSKDGIHKEDPGNYSFSEIEFDILNETEQDISGTGLLKSIITNKYNKFDFYSISDKVYINYTETDREILFDLLNDGKSISSCENIAFRIETVDGSERLKYLGAIGCFRSSLDFSKEMRELHRTDTIAVFKHYNSSD